MTLPNFALHYLRIEWQERGIARRMEISSDPIEIEQDDDGHYRAETQMFRDFHPWVGLRFSDQAVETVPYLVGADGERQPWLMVSDTEGREWWVQDNGWDQERKTHLSELHRSFGEFELHVGSEKLLLVNVSLDLGRTEAEDYLADFRDELITLALNRQSSATGGVIRSESTDLVEALSQFARAARHVVDNPARELSEIEQIQPVGRLRPNARTFREVLRSPSQRRYPGRGAKDNADIPDNRFVRHMVQYCAMLSSRIAHASEAQARQLSARAERARNHARNLLDSDSEKVDPEIFGNQLAEMEAAIGAVNSWSNSGLQGQGGVRDFCIKLENSYDYLPRTQFYKRLDADPREDEKLGITSSIVQLPEEPYRLVTRASKYLNKRSRLFEFSGVGNVRRNPRNRSMRLLELEEVRHMNVRSPGLEKKTALRERYEQSGWTRKLTRAELEERHVEARSSDRRASQLAQRAKLSISASALLSRAGEDLSLQDMVWSALGVATSASLPMGMRFVQSPAYASVLNAFNKVQELAEKVGIGGQEIERIDRIGILHASAIYERWCLVRLISLLTDTFDFTPEHDWLDRVVEGIGGQLSSFELSFVRADVGMIGMLEVQPVLPNGRRPDFRLTFQHREGNSEKASNADVFGAEETEPSTGLVLDAKFRTRWHPGELDRVLHDIVEARGYRQAARRVFILQPAGPVVREPTSPLRWGRDCDYGQNSPANHSQGVVRVSPHPREWHNLHRLVAMELQASFRAPRKIEDEWRSDSFCISCGRRHEVAGIKHRLTKKDRDYWDLTCQDCGLTTRRTHCFSGCGTSLFKNGLILTYHRTIADQLTNVACPCCGEFFDHDIHEADSIRGAFG